MFAPDRLRLGDVVEHTLLRADAQRSDVERHCREAAEHRLAVVCVAPLWVPYCRTVLAGTPVRVAAVVGYPAGAARSELKAVETRMASDDGADEIEVVSTTGLIRGGEWREVAADVAAVVRAAQGRLVKVVLDSAVLAPSELVRVAAIARDEGADYVKTSTGAPFAGEATPEIVALLRLACGDALGVAAAGGVGDAARAAALLASGATRVGTSCGVAIADHVGPGPLPAATIFGVALAGAGDSGGRERQTPALRHPAPRTQPALASHAGSTAARPAPPSTLP